MSDWFIISAGLVTAYLLGSIPTAVWVGKWFYGKDIRNEGSGNAGATNTIRILGIKAGIPVILVDVLKGYLAVYLMQILFPATFRATPLFILRSWPDLLRLLVMPCRYLPGSGAVKELALCLALV